MKHYIDINGDSGIVAYEYSENSIRIQFKTGKIYEYPSSHIGTAHLNTMKRLADSGDGLNAYINANKDVKTRFLR